MAMAFDGIFTRCITDELNTLFAGAKINKIVSPTYDEIIFSIHKNKKKINKHILKAYTYIYELKRYTYIF